MTKDCLNIVDFKCVDCAPDHIQVGEVCIKCDTPTEYIKESQCAKCPTPCVECTISGVCTVCEPFFYLDESKQECLPCLANCKVCPSESECSQCAEDFSKSSNDSECIPMLEALIFTKQIITPENVKLIIPDNFGNSNFSFFAYESQKKTNLPFKGTVIDNCRVKSDLKGCTFCEPGFTLKNGFCLDCVSDCLKCLSEFVCLKCKDTFALIKDPLTDKLICKSTKVTYSFYEICG